MVSSRRPSASSAFGRGDDRQRPASAVDDKSLRRPDLDPGEPSMLKHCRRVTRDAAMIEWKGLKKARWRRASGQK